MDAIGVSGPVTREGADGPVGPETWEHARSRGRVEFLILYFD